MYLFLSQSLDHQLSERLEFTQHAQTRGAHGMPPELAEQFRTQFGQDRDETLRAMLGWSLLSLGVIGVAAGGFGWLLAGRALRPLQSITATARRVADRSLHERIGLQGPNDEIKDLADTFDAMLERLDRAFDSQRRFVANASHELRTPLTINRTLIEVTLDDPGIGEPIRQLGHTLLEVNRRHERLIEGLLLLASSEERLVETSRVDLADIARHVATISGEAAHDAGIEIRTIIAPAHVAGDPLLLEQLAQNLLDNGIRYNASENGWVSISTGVREGYAEVTVENTGPTIPGYDVDGLFEPFRRLTSNDRVVDPSPSQHGRGAGLGLSIVRSIAHAHHGEVHAQPRSGGGLSVHVRIPTVAAQE
jgi:signal transduction histidine kinase